MAQNNQAFISAISTWLMVQLLVSTTTAFAKECSADSGSETISVLELYTSEGCSSCPPAEQWLSSYKPNPQKLIPLAFHVDYWDYIGWKDHFAKAEYSERQRKIAATGGASFVYTPQFVLNGRDFRGLNEARLNNVITEKQKSSPSVNLKLNFSIANNGELSLQAISKASSTVKIKDTNIYIAIYENDLISQVNAGENSGKTLKHDYVVRDFFGAYQLNDQHEFSKNLILNPLFKGKQAGAVMFVQDSKTGDILQSVKLPFCG